MRIRQTATLRRVFSRLALAALLQLPALPAPGEVRRNGDFESFVDAGAITELTAFFRSGGPFALAGGVVFHGRAKFFLEARGGETPVPASRLRLVRNEAGAVFVEHAGRRFEVEIAQRLACRLGRFVARDGMIAFTIPPEEDEAALAEVGLVGGRIAREFAGTVYRLLLVRADFAGVDLLPPALEGRIVDALNTSIDPDRERVKGGTYVNTDHQVTYRVFLVTGEDRVDVSGVPLRYQWSYASDGSALIERVFALSQTWPRGPERAGFDDGRGLPTQYDLINLFQNAGLFRELKKADPEAFDGFVSAICGE